MVGSIDRTDLKQIGKKIQRNLPLVLSAGLIVVVSVILLIQSILPKPALGPSMTDEASPTPMLTALPTSVVTEEKDGQTVPSGLPVIYTVQKGDSLWKISMGFYGTGYNSADIATANNLPNEAYLEVGQELLIPQVAIKETVTVNQSVETEPTTLPTEYQVKEGDSLWKIADQQLGSGYKWVEIYRLNKQSIGANPDLIYPLTRLRLHE